MYKAPAFTEYLEQLEAYLEYVNTDVDRLMGREPDMYAAYGTHNNLKIEEIKNWYQAAEEHLISVYAPETYIMKKYDVFEVAEVWELLEIEVDSGTIYESNYYWFYTE